MTSDREYVIARFAVLVALPKGDLHWEAEDIHNEWLEVLCHERVQYDDNHAKMA
jgi:hypothetical protein